MGGDLVQGELVISIQVHGQVPVNSAIQRSGARPGDGIYVTGTLGDAAIAVQFLQGKLHRSEFSAADYEYFMDRYYQPVPRLEAGIALRNIASSCIDISDGLLADLGHICEAGRVGAQIYLPQLPFSAPMLAVKEVQNRLSAAVTGGDDYELCFTVSRGNQKAADECLKELGLPHAHIGEIIAGTKVQVLDEEDLPVTFDTAGYSHFSETS